MKFDKQETNRIIEMVWQIEQPLKLLLLNLVKRTRIIELMRS